jgi:hypothetical protein
MANCAGKGGKICGGSGVGDGVEWQHVVHSLLGGGVGSREIGRERGGRDGGGGHSLPTFTLLSLSLSPTHPPCFLHPCLPLKTRG